MQTFCVFILSLKKYFIYLFLEKGREKDRERNVNVWLPLMCPQLGTWPATQACALTEKYNQQPFGLQAGALSIEPQQPGLYFIILILGIFPLCNSSFGFQIFYLMFCLLVYL